jgi:hypothetical protein
VFELPRCVGKAGQHAAGAPIRRLQISLPAGTPRVTVLLLPDCDGSELALPVAPLDHWLAKRPVRLTGVPRLGCRARGSRPLRREAAARLGKSKMHSDRAISGGALDYA